MQFYNNPSRTIWPELLVRPQLESRQLQRSVRQIIDRVREKGDLALRGLSLQFDQVTLDHFEVEPAAFAQAESILSADLKVAIQLAAHNIRTFHQAQGTPVKKIETSPGVFCWRRSVAIQRVGLYAPGGSAPLFSTVLMLGIPAQIAGCQEVVLCTPPDRDGNVPPAMLYAAKIAGIKRVFKLGGAQAIAAMAFGTESVPQVDKIYGPGNQYVTYAKQLVQLEGTAIDMPAGPSEVLVVADAEANPEFVAADLISQAEHGPDSQVLLLSLDPDLPAKVQAAMEQQLKSLPRLHIAQQALEKSRSLYFDQLDTALDFVNQYAPEHLILSIENAEAVSESIINAGSVFLGHLTPESLGDYASGTNHTLPTNGYARAYSGLSLDDFVKKITFQEATAEGLYELGPKVATMAEAEGLKGHQRAVQIRLAALVKQTV